MQNHNKQMQEFDREVDVTVVDSRSKLILSNRDLLFIMDQQLQVTDISAIGNDDTNVSDVDNLGSQSDDFSHRNW